MGVNNEFPVLDGIAPSYADIIVRATPQGAPLIEMKDIVSVDRSSTVEVGEQRGASGGRVIKTTTGSVKYELKVVVYRSGFQNLLRNLMRVAPTRRNGEKVISLVHFGFQVQHTPVGSTEIFEWRAKGNRLLLNSLKSAEGVEADQGELSLHTKVIVDMIDGVEVVML